MTIPAGTRERQKADRRERILAAALELMNERGYAATTFDLIADRAGVSRGTVFNYFPYKEALLLAFAATELAELKERVKRSRAELPGWSATDELRFIFAELAAFATAKRDLVLPLSYELLSPDPHRSRAAYLALPLGDLLKGTLKRGLDEGGVRTDHSVERLTRTLANTFFLTALQWAAYRPDRSLRSELSTALKLTLEGIKRQPND